eukprot:GFUD01086316.1.p1 GENE.GFUD01086316.1~~GFUD01086316.1.p1  ORF type:complete len:596 (-),score=125.76 GFUD01086316.1:106-1893(-)
MEILANPFIPKDFCILPPDYGTQGTAKFIEECDSLDQYEYLPIPGSIYQKVGTHPIVCCPRKIYKDDFICFPTDAWCPIYEKIEYDIPSFEKPAPALVMANRTCYDTPLEDGKVLSNCVPINRCAQLLEYPDAPVTTMLPCGFDEEESSLMICCPEEFTTDPVEIVQEPRFPIGNTAGEEARQCKDKHEMCARWKSNDGCALNQNFVISEEDGNGKFSSSSMFGFMQAACAESCEWCGSKGCVDEHPKCKEWSKGGMCVKNPFVMAHMCRESCGVCGFLSPENREDQIIDGKSYTDFTKSNFDCGHYKLLSEIKVDDFEAETEITINEKPKRSIVGNQEYINCGATMINDRWAVTASHCYDDVQESATIGPRQVRVNTIRENTQNKEFIEIKRVFLHPLYKNPNLYNDIAMVELGRRVEYDYESYGDSPICLDQGVAVEGKIGTVQGYGLTVDGTRGKLVEANVTIISNNQCKEQLDFNTTNNHVARKQIYQALPQGLNYGLMCTHGEKNEEGVYPGPCKGDAGGPLIILDENQRSTLVGIVSGGIGCGLQYPSWYTKVDLYTKWIHCIIETSKTMTIKQDIEETCLKQTEKLKK